MANKKPEKPGTQSTTPIIGKESPFTVDFTTEPGLEALGKKEPEPPKAEVPKQISAMDEIQKSEIKARAEAVPDYVSLEVRMINFLSARATGQFVRINDFLKSLYPISKNNEPIEWQKQTNMKSLRAILQKMANERQAFFSNNSYLLLGKPYWPDDKTGVTHYHHLGSVNIEAKLG